MQSLTWEIAFWMFIILKAHLCDLSSVKIINVYPLMRTYWSFSEIYRSHSCLRSWYSFVVIKTRKWNPVHFVYTWVFVDWPLENWRIDLFFFTRGRLSCRFRKRFRMRRETKQRSLLSLSLPNHDKAF